VLEGPVANLGTVLEDNVELFSRLLAFGVVPSIYKSTYTTPHLKKADFDTADVKSYRSISKLSVLSNE
jgi:hypothetical protein